MIWLLQSSCQVLAITLICIQIFNINCQSILAQIGPPAVKSIPLPTGSGARALGQGGAFIAVADDTTAASWNPAGLIQLERPELSIVGAFLTTYQDFSVNKDEQGLAGGIGDEDVTRWDLNFASVSYPFRFLKKNFVTSLNYHQIYDFHVDLSINQSISDLTSIPFDLNRQVDFKSSGGIGALTPSIAVLLLPKLSVGLAINIFDDEFFNSFSWNESITSRGEGNIGTSKVSTLFRSKTSTRDYHGVNVSIGTLWDIWEWKEKLLTFGAVFHSPYTARFDQHTKGFSKSTIARQRSQSFIFEQDSRNKMDWPMSIGMGLGFRYTDALSFSFDVTWTDWSEWVQKTKVSRVDGTRVNISPNNVRPIGGGTEHDEIDDTFAVRFGTEYLLFREKAVIALRGGLFYEPRPSQGSPTRFDLNNNPTKFNGKPTDVWGFSLGAGLTTTRFSLDAAYQFRYVRDMGGRDIGLPETDLDAIESLFIASLIVYF